MDNMAKTFRAENTTRVHSLEFQILTDYQRDLDNARKAVKIMEERYENMFNDIKTEAIIPNHIWRTYNDKFE